MYPIGLMSLAEVRLLSNPNALKAKSLTILMSPRSYMLDYGNYFSTLFQLCPNGTVTCYIQDLDLDLQNASSIRPAISLSQGIRYASGDGSKESPYTIS